MALELPHPDKLPKFNSPPVVETVLSVQFPALDEFTGAHVGWFWKQFLGDDWGSVKVVPRLDDQFERFGEDRKWKSSGGLRFYTEPPIDRHQISRNDKKRMIQVQDTRFIYNWNGGENDYPSYDVILPEFMDYFEKFKQFALDSGNNALVLNQWEVTYVNHIPRGGLWETPADWKNIFPWLSTPAIGVLDQVEDGVQGEWKLNIGEGHGRLTISLRHIRVGSESGPEALSLQLVARGPIDPDDENGLENGFNIGHYSIVQSFYEMTSKMAHDAWGFDHDSIEIA